MLHTGPCPRECTHLTFPPLAKRQSPWPTCLLIIGFPVVSPADGPTECYYGRSLA